MRLGGRALLHAQRQASGLPAVVTVQRKLRKNGMMFTPSASLAAATLEGYILVNMQHVVRVISGMKYLWATVIDEIAVEMRARYCQPHNSTLGACVQHTNTGHTVFNSMKDLEKLAVNIGERKCHLGSEGTVFGMIALGTPPYHTLLVAAFSSCKASNSAQQQRVVEMVEKLWRCRALGYSNQGGRV